jgi:ubiquitin conjugation factor E4 B
VQEQQQGKQRQLGVEERQCGSYLTLAKETVDTFHYLTERIQNPFLTPVGHVATMYRRKMS